jgi:hypothetical protein
LSQVTWSQKFPRIGFLQIAIILLAVATAVIHLYRGVGMGPMMGQAGAHPAGAGAPPTGAGAPPHGAGGPGGPGGLMSMLPLPLPILFDLNFVGYIVLVAALYLPPLQRFQTVIRWVLIAFTAITVILWYILVGSHPDTIGIADKALEVALIVFLLIEAFQSRKRKA